MDSTRDPRTLLKRQFGVEEDAEDHAKENCENLAGQENEFLPSKCFEKPQNAGSAQEQAQHLHHSSLTSASIKQAYLLTKRLIIIIALLVFIASSAATILRAIFGSTGDGEKRADVLAEVQRHLERLVQLTNVAIAPVLFNGTVD